MRRRRRLAALGLVVLILLVAGGAAGALLKQEPDFYSAAPAASSDWEAGERASALVTRVQDLKNDIRAKAEWGASFRADDLNCFFRENLADGAGLAALLPQGFHSPRVVIDGDTVRLGMRYGHGAWSSVVWLELRAWLAKNDTNVIALELCGLHAGAVPVGCQSLLDSITEAAHDSNVDVTWYRHNGNPVGLFRFYADQLRPTTQIHTFKVADGTVTLAGRTRLETAGGNPLGLTD